MSGQGHTVPPDNKPAYFLSAYRGAVVHVLDLRSTFLTVVSADGKTTLVPAGTYLARQVFFRHCSQQELLHLCTFQEN